MTSLVSRARRRCPSSPSRGDVPVEQPVTEPGGKKHALERVPPLLAKGLDIVVATRPSALLNNYAARACFGRPAPKQSNYNCIIMFS